jgi:hypothetical protein
MTQLELVCSAVFARVADETPNTLLAPMHLTKDQEKSFLEKW